jgi:acyl carrier protein
MFVTPTRVAARGRRLYRSGDRIRRRPDGLIEFIGRFDAQVKFAGFRIEPGEVASVIRQFPAISDAVVIASKSENRDTRLIAYVASGPAAIDVTALRNFIAGKLPAFMVPQSFVVLPSLPLTSNGKIDRDALPAAIGATSIDATPAPLSLDEGTIAAIWREVLQRDEVGPRDNFFDLGGDSLRLIEVHARLRKELGVKVPITELFEYPTIQAIAQRLRTAESPGTASLDDAATRARRQRELLAQRSRGRR